MTAPFTVSGPGLEKSYRDFGPALSRALTGACSARADGTWYVRDAAGATVGYASRDARIVLCGKGDR